MIPSRKRREKQCLGNDHFGCRCGGWGRHTQWAYTSLRFRSWEQTSLSTLRGNVTDPTGAVVSGAIVELLQTETSLVRTASTSAAGDFEFPDLRRGTYRLKVTSPGFTEFIADNILLESSQTRRIDVKLELGALGSQVTVRADASVIETDTAKIHSGVTKQRYQELPIPRGWFSPAFTIISLPNVQSERGGLSLRFAGQKSSQTQLGLDGTTSDGTTNQIIYMGDIEEVSTVTVNNSAEFRSVGYFNTITKRGSNDLHGEAFYYHENSALMARPFFDPERPKNLLHSFGISMSGPVIKNRTFFYASWSAERIPAHSYNLRNVPTMAMRGGDFSHLLRLARPAAVRDPFTGSPFPGNIIPASRLNPMSVRTQETYIPAPNLGGSDLTTRNYVFLHPYHGTDRFRADYFTQRVDHHFSDRSTLFVRLMSRFTPYVLPGEYPSFTWTRQRRHNGFGVEHTYLFSAQLVNTARFGWLRDKVTDGIEIDGVTPLQGDQVVSELGLRGVNPRGFSAMGFPRMNITGYPTLRVTPGGLNPVNRDLSFADSATWSTGRHVLKFGGELKTFRNFNGIVPEGTYGIFTFNGTLSGDAYADFLLGLPFSSQRRDPFIDRVRTTRELGLYLQDTFKITSKLTLDYGLRWDYFGEDRYEDGLMYNWDPATGNVVVPGDQLESISPLYPVDIINVVAGRTAANPKMRNFAPRVGAAYRPFGSHTVIRGGYGIFTESLGQYARLQGGGPFDLTETFFNRPGDTGALFAFPDPFPAAAGDIPSQSVAGYPAGTDNGRIHQFNLSIEQQVSNIGFRVSYIGARNRGMNYNLSTNKPIPSLIAFSQSRRPYPQFVGTSFIQSDGRDNYNALQFEVQRKVGQVTFQSHYTLASNMSDYLNLQNPYDYKFWNREGTTTRHRAVFNATWELPIGRGRLLNTPGLTDHLFGGWQIYWMTFLQSGSFFSPSFSGADPSNTNTSGGLPDRVGDGNLPENERTIDRWFDASAFAVPARGRFGNSGVNILEGPSLHVHNATATKTFQLSERFRIRIIAAASNVFNHPNFGLPAANISVPSQAGMISSTYGGSEGGAERAASRRMEMRLRIDF